MEEDDDRPSRTELAQGAREWLSRAEEAATRDPKLSLYHSGYALEFAFKAMICGFLNWECFVPEAVKKPQSFKTHDLASLAAMVAFRPEDDLLPSWSLACEWSSEWKYKVPGEVTPDRARKQVVAVRRVLHAVYAQRVLPRVESKLRVVEIAFSDEYGAFDVLAAAYDAQKIGRLEIWVSAPWLAAMSRRRLLFERIASALKAEPEVYLDAMTLPRIGGHRC